MKTFAAVALLASVAYSQTLPNIPQCALNCFVTALTSDGCSSLTDFACHCAKTSLISSIEPCVQAACSASDQAAVLEAVQDTCESVGVPITISTGAPAASSSAAASTPAAVSTPASASAASSSAAVSTPAVSTVVSTPVGTVSTPAATAGNGTVATGSPSAFTGAAARPTQIGALMAAIGIAAVAL